MTLHVYGLTTCDTVRKARQWLQAQGLDHEFHDLRKEPPRREDWRRWVAAVGWETLLNRRGTTWRALAPARRDAVDGPEAAVELLLEAPAVMKRPLTVWPDGHITVGFDAAAYARQSAPG